MTKIRLLLREIRQANNLSQEELAKALSLSRQSIISLERGEYLPSSPVLLAMLEFFNCPIEQLIDGINIQYLQVQKLEPERGGEQTMQMIPWSPFEAIDHMQDEMNNVVERTFGHGDWSRSLGITAGAMNIHENDKEYEIEIQVPGYDDADLNLEVTENTLTISGNKKSEEAKEGKNLVRREWQHNEFSRSVRFASPIKDSQIDAKLNNGTLTIIAPKVEPVKPKVKKIEVKKK
jgi:HSP20 family protein